MKSGLGVLSITAAVLLCAATITAQSSVEGSYICKTTKGAACMSNTPLQLVNGNWRWGRYFGNYQIKGDKVTFDGAAGPASWGYAIIGPDTLNFNQFGDNSIWQKPQSAPQAALGTYFCQTAPSGCLTNQPIVLRGDGYYTWGPIRGSYSQVGDQLQFAGPTSGPAGWGHADMGNGTITFHAANGSPSVWAMSGAAAAAAPSTPEHGTEPATFEHSLYSINYPPKWNVYGNPTSDVVIAPQNGMPQNVLRHGVLIKTIPRNAPGAAFSANDYVAACDRLLPSRTVGGAGNTPDTITISDRHGFIGAEATNDVGKDELEWIVVLPEGRNAMLVVMFLSPYDRPQGSGSYFEPVMKAMLKSLSLK